MSSAHNIRPIPIPPRTPTPPPDGDGDADDDEANDTVPISPRLHHHPSSSSLGAPVPPGSPRTLVSPSTLSPYSPLLSGSDGENASRSSDGSRHPFQFQSMQYTVGRPPAPATRAGNKGDFSRRRGHKYARSSVSHPIILSPAPSSGTPLQLPSSLPIPTLSEYRSSMTSSQRLHLLWSLLHLLLAGVVHTAAAHASLSLTTLSHLLFLSGLHALLSSLLSIAANFEVWHRSSISHPFGLRRFEVLAALAAGIVLLFMGLDLVSHGVSHAAETWAAEGEQVARHAHPEGEGVRGGGVDWLALIALGVSVVSGMWVGGKAGAGEKRRMSGKAPAVNGGLPSWLREPQHFLPVSLSVLLLMLPLLGMPIAASSPSHRHRSHSHEYSREHQHEHDASSPPTLDVLLGFLYALLMIVLGFRQCLSRGRLLLMANPSPQGAAKVEALVHEIERSTFGHDGQGGGTVRVDEASVWQVHYGLWVAGLRVVVGKGKDGGVREKVERLVRERLEGVKVYGAGGDEVARWEVTVEVRAE